MDARERNGIDSGSLLGRGVGKSFEGEKPETGTTRHGFSLRRTTGDCLRMEDWEGGESPRIRRRVPRSLCFTPYEEVVNFRTNTRLHVYTGVYIY